MNIVVFHPVKQTFVDDGSTQEPLTAEDMPEGWDLHRIEQDLKWNYNGARNLCMHVAPTDWVLCTDLDHLVTEPVLEDVDKLISMDMTKLYRFNRYHAKSNSFKPHGSSWLVHKEEFWKRGGYQEETTGYGQDAKFAARWGGGDKRHNAGPNIVYLDEYFLENFVPDGSKVTKQARGWREVTNPNYPDREHLRFDWRKLA